VTPLPPHSKEKGFTPEDDQGHPKWWLEAQRYGDRDMDGDVRNEPEILDEASERSVRSWGAKLGVTEPNFIAQGSAETREEAQAWWKDRSIEAMAEGCTFCRYSQHPTITDLILFEAWQVQPRDQGEPRWQLMRMEA